MNRNVLILLLTANVVGIQSHPIGIIIETGIKSKAEFKANDTVKAGPGWDKGPTLEGKARSEASGSWYKNIFGKAYFLDSKGDTHGLSASAGSIIDGNAVAEIGSKGKTNIIHTKIDKNAILDGDASYKAGADIHFIDKSEVEGIEGVNRRIINHSEEKSYNFKQSSEDSKPITPNSEQNIENSKPAPDASNQESTEAPKGLLRRAWNWIGK